MGFQTAFQVWTSPSRFVKCMSATCFVSPEKLQNKSAPNLTQCCSEISQNFEFFSGIHYFSPPNPQADPNKFKSFLESRRRNVWGWNGSSGSGFRSRRFLWGRGFKAVRLQNETPWDEKLEKKIQKPIQNVSEAL